MIVATKILVLFCIGYIIAALIYLREETREKNVTYYTIETMDGEILMSYVDRKLAAEECHIHSYSGICHKRVVGRPDKTEFAFIW